MSVHLCILVSKLDTFSDSEFNKYWSESHPKIWLGVKVVQEKVIKYSQFHVDRETTKGLEAHGLPFVHYDGGVNIWTKSVEDMMAIFQDEEYLRVVVPDEEGFIKRSEARMMLGHDEDKWVDGKAT